MILILNCYSDFNNNCKTFQYKNIKRFEMLWVSYPIGESWQSKDFLVVHCYLVLGLPLNTLVELCCTIELLNCVLLFNRCEQL